MMRGRRIHCASVWPRLAEPVHKVKRLLAGESAASGLQTTYLGRRIRFECSAVGVYVARVVASAGGLGARLGPRRLSATSTGAHRVVLRMRGRDLAHANQNIKAAASLTMRLEPKPRKQEAGG